MFTLALIGAGKWGKNFINTVASMPNCRIKYICANSKTTLKNIPDQFEKTTNYKSLLKKKDIDGVIIATPPGTHFRITKSFLNAGFKVLVEKPLVLNLKDANELERILKIKKGNLMVGHTYLFSPAFISLRRLIHRLGRVNKFIFEGLQSNPRDDVSVIWDWGPHPISILLSLFEKEPKEIKILKEHKTKKGLTDSLKISMMVDEIFVLINISWVGKKSRKIILEGTKGNLILNDLNKLGKKLIFVGKHSGKQSYIKYQKSLPLTNEVNAFLRLISKNSESKSSLKLEKKAIKILYKIDELTRRT